MPTAAGLHICWCSENGKTAELCAILASAGFRVSECAFDRSPVGEFRDSNLVLIGESAQKNTAMDFCRRLRVELGEEFVPILYITSDLQPRSRLASLECGADAYLLHPFEPAELLAQVKALVRIKERHDRLIEKSAEVRRINKRLQMAHQQMDRELAWAARIQGSFLPKKLPAHPKLRFAAHYQPSGKVGGDFYDVLRLDENHFGMYIADVMGHGVPASLLTIFVKKGIQTKDITGNDYHLVSPGEVLARLNQDLIQQAVYDSPFITMVYALINFAEGTFHFARSGHPHPIYLPREGAAKYLEIEGTLLGVFDTNYAERRQQIKPGDKVLFHTDGIDSVRFEEDAAGAHCLLRFAEKHRDLPIESLLEKTAAEFIGREKQNDDVTLLGLEFC